MSYLALARKWRPRTFSQLVGQDHINQALVNSLNQQRLHHAYLFTGTRGVGKTSVARLMAKALNCEQGVSAEPCLQCEPCLAIEEGRFIDLIEVDAASKTRVEDTRDLLDNVQYAPTSGRFKIYLIDEVHMLSQHSFNALLKTLEEPPAHVKFLLATTDPQKLPVTILSRCLQFNLHHLSPELIGQQLQYIVDQEKQPCEPQALALLAKAAKGSMRDALSLLDQVIASADNLLTAQKVKSLLGYTQQDYALPLLQALIHHDAPALIQLSRTIAREGGHFAYVLNEMLDYLHQMTLCQALAGEHPLLQSPEAIKALAQQVSAEDTQLFYQIALKGLEDMPLAPTQTIGFEMTLLRMLAFKPAGKSPLPPLAHEIPAASEQTLPVIDPGSPCTAGQAARPLSPANPPPLQPEDRPPVPDEPSFDPGMPVVNEAAVTEEPQPTESSDLRWDTLLPRLKLSGLAQNAVENAELISKNGRNLVLRVDKGHQSLFTPAIQQRIEQALSQFYGESIKLTLNTDGPTQATPAQKKQQAQQVRMEMAENSLQNDPFLLELQQQFSAEVVKNSIVPAEDPL
ncbi:DNA polymerase III subunit gamma/tau [Legionella taurinensis]|uniref:DNA polymerase III subunit gamma/tau n=1 Tax=Legionella taurinensis TaxID=70611 RepID=A0AB38N3U9_9GAMM|nr:DNA polymerase III subunit gamma/tau [Legionella taurinensis]MDX1838528.1 DNA polymerase III subunit gamma/tau [Legionella taurinensis]PUT38973.1 DNA polymerase III, subunit gamma and tau [Legionella taurinensis]PUT41034.1 DNA polymerase III, subunit gamma and tau [Legionella taurinensis]PUT43267.1 DNA polymerase III, subunit gamma and tau [Legionella taurinensis]PUT46452.1 DNA polymerase III, subunit gamma and tau [Legionella taurinensis]